MSDLLFKTETAKKRHHQVLKAIDRIAQKDQLAFLTTKKVSQESDVSDGVLFRLFSSKESMMSAWLDSRGEYLRFMLQTAPSGRYSLHQLIQKLLNDKVALSFLCCHPMDTPYLREQLEYVRTQFRRFLHTHIELTVGLSESLTADALTDHLLQSIYRAWDPESSQRGQYKELLMNKLPWEKEANQTETFPSQELLQRLALNDSGFVFDPESGRSFTSNAVGLYVLRFLQKHSNADGLLTAIESDFDVSRNDAERDVTEFAAQLRKVLV
ncbi:MAG: hypothetical protein COB41_05055 [Proteobacteria bacterium]|nr:MAG: hypothetical protein COB41_05055 [Pseudomonadota bacterium]